MWARSLDWEDPLDVEMATCSSILAWKIPWTEEPGGLQSMRLQRVRHNTHTHTDTHTHTHTQTHTQTHTHTHSHITTWEHRTRMEILVFLMLCYLLTITLQSYPSPTHCCQLCATPDGSPPGSAVPGTLQARTLEWVAISFSNAWKWKVKSLSRVWPSATPWTAAY